MQAQGLAYALGMGCLLTVHNLEKNWRSWFKKKFFAVWIYSLIVYLLSTNHVCAQVCPVGQTWRKNNPLLMTAKETRTLQSTGQLGHRRQMACDEKHGLRNQIWSQVLTPQLSLHRQFLTGLNLVCLSVCERQINIGSTHFRGLFWELS